MTDDVDFPSLYLSLFSSICSETRPVHVRMAALHHALFDWGQVFTSFWSFILLGLSSGDWVTHSWLLQLKTEHLNKFFMDLCQSFD